MRGVVTFLVLLASSVVVVSVCALVVGASALAAGLGCVAGAIATIGASIIVNTRNANRYGRRVWEEAQHSDFDEPVVGSHRVRVRRGRGRGVHEASFSGLEG